MSQIIWTRPAENDLRKIFDFLTEKLSWEDEKALSVIDNIFDKTDTLLTGFSAMGQVEPLLKDHKKEYRYLIQASYKLIYSFEKNNFYVHMVFDTRQNPKKLQDRFNE